MSENIREIFICKSLTMRYSVSVIKSSTRFRDANGFFNNAKFYLYSPALKGCVGKPWYKEYPFTKKAVASGIRPEVKLPDNKILSEALANLLILNKGIPTTLIKDFKLENIITKMLSQVTEDTLSKISNHFSEKKFQNIYFEKDLREMLNELKLFNSSTVTTIINNIKRSEDFKCIELNQDELFIFWLLNFDEIMEDDLSKYTDEVKQLIFANLCIKSNIGAFDLSDFTNTNVGSELEKISDRLVGKVKSSLGYSDKDKTVGIRNNVKYLRLAINLYLKNKDINSNNITDYMIGISTPRKGIAAKIGEAMRPTALPLDTYRTLFKLLSKKPTDEHIAVIFMLFLGLTPEETAGLNVGDIRKISGYSGAYQVQIIRSYEKVNGKYVLNYLDEEDQYRFIPVPKVIYNLIPDEKKKRPAKAENENPLLLYRGKRIKPDALKKTLYNLITPNPEEVILPKDDKYFYHINLAFLPSSYRISCRYYWYFYCGLEDSEVRYLSGLTPDNTLAAHYIDYNNYGVLHHMLKQMEYGMNMVTKEEPTESIAIKPVLFKKNIVSGRLTSRAGLKITVTGPAEIEIYSEQGIVITREVTE